MRRFRPRTVPELLAWVRARRTAGERIWCGGSAEEPEKPEVWQLDRRDLTQVRFFDPDDMVVGVEAGTTWLALQNLLAPKGMWLPVYPWDPTVTLAEMCDTNQFGPARLMGGGLRDFLIGMEYINGQGELIRVGGKVVKNVTGYDLGRMMIGARSGLGLITALHFRVVPLPVDAHLWQKDRTPQSILAGLADLWTARVPLDSVQVRVFRDQASLAVGYSGGRLRRERIAAELTQSLGPSDQVRPSAKTSVFALDTDDGPLPAALMANARFREFVDAAISSESSSAHLSPPWHVFAVFPTSLGLDQAFFERVCCLCDTLVWHPIGADAHLFLRPGASTGERLGELLEVLGEQPCVISLVRGPDEWRHQLHPSRPEPPGYRLMKRLRATLDPQNFFNAPFYEEKA